MNSPHHKLRSSLPVQSIVVHRLQESSLFIAAEWVDLEPHELYESHQMSECSCPSPGMVSVPSEVGLDPSPPQPFSQPISPTCTYPK